MRAVRTAQKGRGATWPLRRCGAAVALRWRCGGAVARTDCSTHVVPVGALLRAAEEEEEAGAAMVAEAEAEARERGERLRLCAAAAPRRPARHGARRALFGLVNQHRACASNTASLRCNVGGKGSATFANCDKWTCTDGGKRTQHHTTLETLL